MCFNELRKESPHLILQRPYAHVLLVELVLLGSDPLQQIIDASVLVLQHHLITRNMFFNQLYSSQLFLRMAPRCR